MAKGLGLYFSDGRCKWVVSELADDTLRISGAGEYIPDEEQPFILPEDLPEDVALVFSPDESYFYNLSFPFRSRNKINAVLKNDIEERCLDPVDSIVADFYIISQEGEQSDGVCVTLPKEKIRNALEIAGDRVQPSVITLDIYVLVNIISKTGIRQGRYFLISFTERSAFLTEISDGVVQKVRGIPVAVESGSRAKEAVDELVKRFEIEDPENSILVYSGIDRIDSILHSYDQLNYEVLNVKTALGETDGVFNLLIPAAAAAASADPGRLPDFRKEEFSGGGVLSRLTGHSTLLLGACALILFVLILIVSYLKSGYEQQVRSLNARMKDEAELALDKKELEDAMGAPGMKLPGAVEKIYKKYKTQVKGGAESSELPESAFKMLNEILGYFPEDLDVSWDRIIVQQRSISFRGTCEDNARNIANFDSFVNKVVATGNYSLGPKSSTGGSIRVTFRNIRNE